MIDVTFQRIDQIRTSSDHDTDKLLITKEAYWSAHYFLLRRLDIFIVKD